MPNVMIRVKDNGNLLFYIAKKDQEDEIAVVEHDNEDSWGGEVELTDGSKWWCWLCRISAKPLLSNRRRTPVKGI